MWLDCERCDIRIIDILHYTRERFEKHTAKRGFAVISCRLSGKCCFHCGGEVLYADPQNYVLIPPDTEYEQSCTKDEIICIHMNVTGLNLDRIKSVYCPSVQIRQSFLELYALWQEKRTGYYLKCKSLIFNILSEFITLSESSSTTEAQAMIAPTVDCINRTFYKSDFSIEYAISQSHISPAYFRRLFKTLYRTTPITYVNKMRIERAKSLLLSRTLTLGEIAEACGFLHDKYFFAMFRKVTGTTPSEWLALHG